MRLPARLITAIPLATAMTLTGAAGQDAPVSCVEACRAVTPAALPAPAADTIRREATGAAFEALERTSADRRRTTYEAFFGAETGGISVMVLPDGTLIDRRARSDP
jgi:hypothetical protein